MLKSMTGYGRCSDCIDGFDVSFEIRSVNTRYLDTNIRLPRIYGYLEEKIKKAIQKKAARGKVDAFLTVERPVGEATEIVLDEALAAQYVGALRKIAENFRRDSGPRIVEFDENVVQNQRHLDPVFLERNDERQTNRDEELLPRPARKRRDVERFAVRLDAEHGD